MVLQDSFEIHNRLNPKIWGKDNRLLQEVEEKIKETVDLFINSVELPLRIIDIHIVGSNASFNYTEESDLDVHIVINYSNMDAPAQLVELLMNALRSNFNLKHDIKIHGISLEIFVEDVQAGITSNGIYSVLMKRWIKFPKRLNDIPNVDVSDDLTKWVRKIDAVLDREDKDEVQQTIDRLYLIRKNSIAKDGEFGYGNQLFKEIRNLGKIKELKDLATDLETKYLSLENYKNTLTEDVVVNDPESGEEIVQKEPDDAITEKSRMALLNQSKSSEKGMERYKKRTKSKLAATVKQFNSIDMNKLFKDDIFTIDISVKGETDEYVVRISYGGFLTILHDQLKSEKKDKVDLKMITRALIIGFNRGDVYIHCNCFDSQFRFQYWQTRKGINSGKPQNIPSKITNPNDSLGSACKHTLLVLSNTSWILKCARTIWNYINYIKDHYSKLYQTIIYPAVYGKEYEEPIQMDIFDDNGNLETDKDTIDKSNQYGRDRTKFQKGNTKGVRFAKEPDKNQLSFDDTVEVEEEQ